MNTIKTLVIPDRIHTRLQAEIYFAFESALKSSDIPDGIKLVYSVFNPFMAKYQFPSKFYDRQIEFMKLLSSDLSQKIIDIKDNMKKKDTLWEAIQKYMGKKPDSILARVYNELENFLIEYSFIIIESTARTAIHPFYYDKKQTEINYDFAKEYDLIDTLLGLFYIDIALKYKIPMFATCHGAQLAYLHAGGGMKILVNPYYFVPENYYYPKHNPHGGPVEIWQFDEDLLNARNIRNGSEISVIRTPLPDLFNPGDKDEKKYINRDFNQTLAMTAPVPENIDILLYHPLSMFVAEMEEFEVKEEILEYPEVSKEKIKEFKRLLKPDVIVDAFTYKCIYAFQHHPHYDYNFESNSEIFKYLIRKVISS
ncbi:MAG TPA: hypothetical protein QF753_16155 [Victivallales bacterium]|nr:hypothetical protein [Victivallales bacterium]